MDKTIEEINYELDKEILDQIAKNLMDLRVFPNPTVRDLHPLLTEKELDYVMSKYKGPMERG